MHTHAPLVSHILPSWVWTRPSATVYWALTVYDLWGVTFSPFSLLFILSLADFSSGHNWSWSTSSPALCLLTFSSETDLSEQAWSWRPHCPPLSNTSSTLTHRLRVKCPYQAGGFEYLVPANGTVWEAVELWGHGFFLGSMGFELYKPASIPVPALPPVSPRCNELQSLTLMFLLLWSWLLCLGGGSLGGRRYRL